METEKWPRSNTEKGSPGISSDRNKKEWGKYWPLMQRTWTECQGYGWVRNDMGKSGLIQWALGDDEDT